MVQVLQLLKRKFPSACSGSIFGNGQMLVMRTIEDPTNPLGKLIGSQQPVGLDHFSLAVYPLGFYGVEPRTLLGHKAAYDPHSLCALFDFSVVRSEPASDLPADLWVKAPPRRQPLRPSQESQGSR